MNVFVNSKEEITNENETLFGLLLHIELAEKNGIAVAINNHIIQKAKWPSVELKANDKITIIKATQGG